MEAMNDLSGEKERDEGHVGRDLKEWMRVLRKIFQAKEEALEGLEGLEWSS